MANDSHGFVAQDGCQAQQRTVQGTAPVIRGKYIKTIQVILHLGH